MTKQSIANKKEWMTKRRNIIRVNSKQKVDSKQKLKR